MAHPPDTAPPARIPWTDRENDLIVADYFAMLDEELAGRHYNKSAHRRALHPLLNGRSEQSVEFKHQNISAVLQALGEVWIGGYKPAFNFQTSLIDAVARWLDQQPEWLERPPARLVPGLTPGPAPGMTPGLNSGSGSISLSDGLQEAASLYVGPAPTLSNQPPPQALDQMLQVAAKFDVAGRDARNRALGRAGEAHVLAYERATLAADGRGDLAGRVRWVSDQDGDGAGYDIASFTPEGAARLIEVKTTNGWDRTPFHVTRNELAVAERHRSEWYLFRLWDFSRTPKAFELRPPLDDHVSLTPTTFQAGFH